jgi:hypothetical protein
MKREYSALQYTITIKRFRAARDEDKPFDFLIKTREEKSIEIQLIVWKREENGN